MAEPVVPFVPLHVHSGYSFLDATAAVEDLVRAAAQMGYPALALTDRGSLSGAVRLVRTAREQGIRPILGAEVDLPEAGRCLLLADGPEGYVRLSRLLSAQGLGEPLPEERQGLLVLTGGRMGGVAQALLERREEEARRRLARLVEEFGADQVYLELERMRLPGERDLEEALLRLGREWRLKPVATSAVHYLHKEHFWLYDLLTCVGNKGQLEDVGSWRRMNAENYLRSPEEMRALFADRPEALAGTAEVVERARPPLEVGRVRFPRALLPEGTSPEGRLRELAERGARWRYPTISPALWQRIEAELQVIGELGFAGYFLIVWEVAWWARRQGIRIAGRGSAADSVVAYVLGLTEVDAWSRSLLFERFMSRERAERPDIDLDVDARYRDRVAAHVVERYGRERVAGLATFATYRGRMLVRDLGRVLGLTAAQQAAVARRIPGGMPADRLEEALVRYPELREIPDGRRRLSWLLEAGRHLAGLPRHLGTHGSGVLIGPEPLRDVGPLVRSPGGEVILAFDKEDVEDLGLLKLDLLSLRAFSVLTDTVSALPRGEGSIPKQDGETFAMLRRGESIGVFQLESPAQRALMARMEARETEDLIQALALIRPGPIKGNMVEPYLARRRGREEVTYLHPRLEPILRKTYGVVLFQEQVIAIATEVAGFTPGEADQLRRVMSHARSGAAMAALGERFVLRAREQGIGEETARQIFAMLEGYASYGFCEAHAAAFGQTAYQTAYLLRHHPADYFAALLNHQPMGCYPPRTLVAEARRRGVRFLPLDITASGADHRTEEGAIRIGLKAVRGMGKEYLDLLLAWRERGGPILPEGLLPSGLPRPLVESLCLAGAFDQVLPNRRALLFSLGRTLGPLAPRPDLPDYPEALRRALEMEVLGLESGEPLFALWREALSARGILPTREVRRRRQGEEVQVAGWPLHPHRPPTRSGKITVFWMLEDETGTIDAHLFEEHYQKTGAILFRERIPPLLVTGRVVWRGKLASLEAHRVEPLFPEGSG